MSDSVKLVKKFSHLQVCMNNSRLSFYTLLLISLVSGKLISSQDVDRSGSSSLCNFQNTRLERFGVCHYEKEGKYKQAGPEVLLCLIWVS